MTSVELRRARWASDLFTLAVLGSALLECSAQCAPIASATGSQRLLNIDCVVDPIIDELARRRAAKGFVGLTR